MLNRNFNDFKFQHKRNKNQILYTTRKITNDDEVLNLIDNFLLEKNSFVFESVEKGKIRGRYTIFGKNPDKIWEFNNNNSYLITKKTKKNYNNATITTAQVRVLTALGSDIRIVYRPVYVGPTGHPTTSIPPLHPYNYEVVPRY